MKPKVFIGFAAVTVIAVVGAGYSIATHYFNRVGPVEQERVFPGLTQNQAEIGSISVQTAKETLTAKNEGGKWSIVERSGYPGSDAKMEKVMLALAELRFSEPKTKMKDRYKRLAVEDLGEKNAQSRRLTVKDKDGKVLADLIVGRQNRAISGPTGTGLYIRKPGDAQSWLAIGVLDVPKEPKDWIDPKIMNVAKNRIRKGVIVHPDGKKFIIEKKQQVEKNFTLVDKPEGRKVKYESDIQNVGQGLEDFEVDDVRKADKVTFPADKLVKTEYRTFDGLVVDVVSYEGKTEDEGFWAKFTASVDEDAAKAAMASASAADDAKKPEAAGKNGAKAGDDKDAKDDEATKPIDVHKEAAQINATVGGWAFKIPAYKYRYMSRTVEEVLEKAGDKKKGS